MTYTAKIMGGRNIFVQLTDKRPASKQPDTSPVDCVLKCDGTRAETIFRLSEKRTSPFKSAGTSVQLTTGSRCVRISVSKGGYTMFRGSVKSNGYPLHSPVSPPLPLLCVTVFHHISTGLYLLLTNRRGQPEIGPLSSAMRLQTGS